MDKGDVIARWTREMDERSIPAIEKTLREAIADTSKGSPMERIGEYSKAIAAAVVAVLALIEIFFGWDLGIGEEWVLSILAVLTPILVWAVPNS